MSAVAEKLLKLRTSKLLKSNRSKRETVNYDAVNEIGILFTIVDREKHNAIKQLAKQFKADGKQVEVLCFLGKGKENYDFLYNYISSTDISALGKMNSGSAITFAKKNFDYLFYVDLHSNIYLENILAMSNAKCRVGIFEEKKDAFFELMLNINRDKKISQLVDQMYYYTKKLGK
ncbi:MAG: DUF6913 domain-containing protein [Cyclobacteriaceae bacterium]